jgi:hypothetical protein
LRKMTSSLVHRRVMKGYQYLFRMFLDHE